MPVKNETTFTDEELEWKELARDRKRMQVMTFMGAGVAMSNEHEDFMSRDKLSTPAAQKENGSRPRKKKPVSPVVEPSDLGYESNDSSSTTSDSISDEESNVCQTCSPFMVM